jgi:hypothetical protein
VTSKTSVIRKRLLVLASICLILSAGPALGQDDAFIRQRDAEAAKNASTGFSIRFADGRRTFHPGQAIKLVFSFQGHGVSPFNWEHCSSLGVADAVLDHADGTVDPQADLWDNGLTSPVCGVLSGISGGGGVRRPDGTVEVSPWEFPVYLNQGVRFDRPGRYRFYVRSRHRLVSDPSLPPLVSNVLELDIVDRDPKWEDRTLEEAVGVLDSSTDYAARAEAARAIAFLGSRDAVDEMAKRFYRVSSVRADAGSQKIDPDSALDQYWLRGIYGAREREHVVAQLAEQLDRPDRFISPGFVSDLAVLELTRQTTARPIDRSAYDSLRRSYAARHLAAQKAAGRLRPDLQQTFAFAAKHSFLRLDALGLTEAYAKFPEDVDSAFATLQPAAQQKLLNGVRNWTVFHDPVFIPMLRRLAAGRTPDGPQDTAFRLLYDLTPDEGRQIALRELADPRSVLSITGLSVLPDPELPALEDTFAQSLEAAATSDDYGRALDRVERFATVRILPRVQKVYERSRTSRSCELAPPALAYFFRVEPGYARTELIKVTEAVFKDGGCKTGMLPAIAKRRMVATLEESAIQQLNHPNARVVADAATMLQEYGTARAEGPLWLAMERWHERWKDQAARLDADRQNSDGIPWEQALERYLSDALEKGTGWLMNDASARRLTSLCVTSDCKTFVTQAFRSDASDPSISVAAPILPRAEPLFAVRDNRYVFLRSRDAFHRYLLLYPRGTTFRWTELHPPRLELRRGDDEERLPGEADRCFDETRAFLDKHGMALTRRQ